MIVQNASAQYNGLCSTPGLVREERSSLRRWVWSHWYLWALVPGRLSSAARHGPLKEQLTVARTNLQR